MTPDDLEPLWQRVTEEFALPAGSCHGPSHWRRVEANGLLLADQTGARSDVVRLFAVLHDARRWNEYDDPQHGPRGAALAVELRGVLFEIDDSGFALLHEACCVHTSLHRSPDPTIGACLDADRLDLGRVGIIPDPKFMSTHHGRLLAEQRQRG